MNRHHCIRFAVLTLAVCSFSATAAEESKTKFMNLDTDGDGYISRSEATADLKLRERWNGIDQDKDGKLTEKEFSVFANAPDQPFPDN